MTTRLLQSTTRGFELTVCLCRREENLGSKVGLRSNYAMALNEEDHRLFTITRKTTMLIVLNTHEPAQVWTDEAED